MGTSVVLTTIVNERILQLEQHSQRTLDSSVHLTMQNHHSQEACEAQEHAVAWNRDEILSHVKNSLPIKQCSSDWDSNVHFPGASSWNFTSKIREKREGQITAFPPVFILSLGIPSLAALVQG